MTLQEALTALKIERHKAQTDFYSDRREALDIAIDLIRKEIRNETKNYISIGKDVRAR